MAHQKIFLSAFAEISYEKECNGMVTITREERNYLMSQGFKVKEDLFKSHSRHPKYYLVETPKAVRVLEDYRKSKIVVAVTQTRSGKVVRSYS